MSLFFSIANPDKSEKLPQNPLSTPLFIVFNYLILLYLRNDTLILGKRINPAVFSDYKECLRVKKDAIEKDPSKVT